ncbi:MAG: hypothetical protein HZC36_12240 [Armatimonadetes bacterium]|nr:hypothetical protein [Armatimonadota bacterium]
MPVTDYCTIDGEIVSEIRNGTERDYVPDPLGSTVALLDGSQTKTDTYTYWPYGEMRTSTGTNATPFKFAGTLGYFRDSSTRTYVRARTYQQGYGRWMTVDTLWPIQPSYAYCQTNPVTWIDALGTRAHKPPFGGIVRNGSNQDIVVIGEQFGDPRERSQVVVLRTGERTPCGFDADWFRFEGKWYRVDHLFLPTPRGGRVSLGPGTRMEGEFGPLVTSLGETSSKMSRIMSEQSGCRYGIPLGTPCPEGPYWEAVCYEASMWLFGRSRWLPPSGPSPSYRPSPLNGFGGRKANGGTYYE